MKTLELRSFGPILGGQVEFGDLTVLVGPQASGKSLFVQMYKVIQDAGAIRKDFKEYGFRWGQYDLVGDYLTIYFGGGMRGLWKRETAILVDGIALDFRRNVVDPSEGASTAQTVLLIPAQRVLALQGGWPRPFMDFARGDPYCLRRYSETLRRLMEDGLEDWRAVFRGPRRLNAEVRRLIDEGVYVGGKVCWPVVGGMRTEIVLAAKGGSTSLFYNAWSAGQREFTPLLLGLHWLIPSGKTGKRDAIETVVVEEPEMGLHPRAIMSFCLLVLELLDRGYKVILSTHSPVVLDVVWALRELRAVGQQVAVLALKDIFGIKRLGQPTRGVLAGALKKDYRTYYFGQSAGGVNVRDISSLDPGDKNPDISGWGGLSGFSGDTADIVGRALSGRKG